MISTHQHIGVNLLLIFSPDDGMWHLRNLILSEKPLNPRGAHHLCLHPTHRPRPYRNQPSDSYTRAHGWPTGHSSCISTTKKDAPFFSRHSSLPHTSTPSRPRVLGFCDISQQLPSCPVKPLPPRARVPLNSLLVSAIPFGNSLKWFKPKNINTTILWPRSSRSYISSLTLRRPKRNWR